MVQWRKLFSLDDRDHPHYRDEMRSRELPIAVPLTLSI
jgi:hypothetical protein